MVGGALLVRYPRPWMLIKVLIAFVPFHRLLHGACGLFPEGHLTYVGGVMVCMHISLIELLLWSVVRQVPALEYMLSCMRTLAFVRQ
jgi:hypothetical protein